MLLRTVAGVNRISVGDEMCVSQPWVLKAAFVRA